MQASNGPLNLLNAKVVRFSVSFLFLLVHDQQAQGSGFHTHPHLPHANTQNAWTGQKQARGADESTRGKADGSIISNIIVSTAAPNKRDTQHDHRGEHSRAAAGRVRM